MLCYHEEAFLLGMSGALMFFAVITLFEEGLKKGFERVRKVFS